MICNKCKQRVATVHLSQVINNSVSDVYLCQYCANENAVAEMQAALGVANMLPGFFTVGGGINEYMKAKPELAKCSNCGKSFLEIRKDGRLGCATCYSDFSSKLKPIIEGIYGSVAHKGRYPKSMAEKYKKLMGAREITELKILLDKAVQAEEYERAAEIRDSIRSLEKNTDKEAR